MPSAATQPLVRRRLARRMTHRWLPHVLAAVAVVGTAFAGDAVWAAVRAPAELRLASAVVAATMPTSIRHPVGIYPENESFDHGFGTHPHAVNPAGEPSFHAVPGTPRVNGLTPALLTHNPNSANPRRLGRGQMFRATTGTAAARSNWPSMAAGWTASSPPRDRRWPDATRGRSRHEWRGNT